MVALSAAQYSVRFAFIRGSHSHASTRHFILSALSSSAILTTLVKMRRYRPVIIYGAALPLTRLKNFFASRACFIVLSDDMQRVVMMR